MSFFCRYFSSRRRRPTSSSSPRRLWWSCLCVFRCSVRSLIRRVSSATWTSGDPVSPSPVAYSAMIWFLTAVSRDTWLLLRSSRAETPVTTRGVHIVRFEAARHLRVQRARLLIGQVLTPDDSSPYHA